MEVPVKYFMKWSRQLQFKTTSYNSVWLIYPVHFCAMQKITYVKHIEMEVGLVKEGEKAANPETYRQINVQFTNTCRRYIMRDIPRYTVVDVRRLMNIPAGADLFDNSVNQYNRFDV